MASKLSCVKYVVVIFNFLFLLCGIAVAAMGAYTIFNSEDLSALIGDSMLKKGAYLLLAAGGAVILISTVGCFGALTENKCLLVLYFVVLLMTFLVQAVAGIMGFVFYGQLETYLKSHVEETMNTKYGRKGFNLITLAVDKMQMEFECCGFNSPEDWKNATYFNSSSAVPISCCVDMTVNDCNKVINNSTMYTQGCFPKLLSWVQGNIDIVGGLGIGVALFQEEAILADAKIKYGDIALEFVIIYKTKPTLGVAIEGGINTRQPEPTVISIQRGGSAFESGRLKCGHTILEVNGQSLRGMEHRDAVKTIAEAFRDPSTNRLYLLVTVIQQEYP
uniref:Tetraspanin-11 n=1 Tax=Magallana gigas TaxID=29159 RepID=K1Q141_MAGGI